MAKALRSLSSKLICGALAGFVATAPMTAVMQRMYRSLDRKERYPLPPREILGSVVPPLARGPATNTTLVAHFAYGAVSGAALSTVIRNPTTARGVAGGLSVWLASYLGWVPAFGILKPASRHPASRNALMIFAHVVWGAAYAITQRDLMKSGPAFADGPLKDADAVQKTKGEIGLRRQPVL